MKYAIFLDFVKLIFFLFGSILELVVRYFLLGQSQCMFHGSVMHIK